MFQNIYQDYPQNAAGDAGRLEKYYKCTSTEIATFIMRMNDYKEFVFAGNPTIHIKKKLIVARSF